MAIDITLELSPSEEAALRALAAREGKTIGEAVRQRLEEQPPSGDAGFTEQAHRRHQNALLALAKDHALATGDLDRALAAITAAAAATLDVERVSVWLYDEFHTAIRSVDLYELSRRRHSAGTLLLAQAYPSYFDAIASNRAVVVPDARGDPRTFEFTETYLIPHGITSMLDAPIQWGGRTVGILCVEHVGPRRAWTLEEESFTASIADMVAHAFEHEALRRAEDEAHRRKIEFDQQQELQRIKANLISMVSHELRTPLTSIVAYVEFLEDDLAGPLTPEQRTFVERLSQNAGHLQRLVNDLLDFARLEAGTFRLVNRSADLSQKVREVAEVQRQQAEAKGVGLEIVLPPEPVMAYHDAFRFGQVLSNLVGNAVKFTPEGGVVTITLKSEAEGPRVEVRDTGVGIASEHLPHLFEHFFQVDSSSTREQAGVGLGLSIVKSLVDLMGGRIGVESELGAGSTFWFTMPFNGSGVGRVDSLSARGQPSDGY